MNGRGQRGRTGTAVGLVTTGIMLPVAMNHGVLLAATYCVVHNQAHGRPGLVG